MTTIAGRGDGKARICSASNDLEARMSESGSGEIKEWIARLEQHDQRLAQALELLARNHAPARSGRDWSAYAAVIASLIGLLALGVSGYTAYVQRQQLRAEVWPHLRVSWSDSMPGLHVTNDGTGPARVTAVRVAVDGKPVKSWLKAMTAAGITGDDWGISILGRTVLPPGRQVDILQPSNNDDSRAKVRELVRGKHHNFTIALCYCSVLDDCWVLDSESSTSSGDCQISAGERFTQ